MKFIQIFCALIFLFVPNAFTQTSTPFPVDENSEKSNSLETAAVKETENKSVKSG